jgi:hypothetical protein
MGNRAVITFTEPGQTGVGAYVHWNGGRASVRAFLHVCWARGYRSPDNDPSYAMAGLVGVLREFFGPEGLSVGVDVLDRLPCDNFDNGVYQVGPDWKIVGSWGEGSAGLEYTNGKLYGRELEQYEGIVAQLVDNHLAACAVLDARRA